MMRGRGRSRRKRRRKEGTEGGKKERSKEENQKSQLLQDFPKLHAPGQWPPALFPAQFFKILVIYFGFVSVVLITSKTTLPHSNWPQVASHSTNHWFDLIWLIELAIWKYPRVAGVFRWRETGLWRHNWRCCCNETISSLAALGSGDYRFENGGNGEAAESSLHVCCW